MTKLSNKELEELKKLREEGWNYKDLAENFNISINAISYHLNPEQNLNTRRRAMKSFLKNKDKHKESMLSWRARNPEAYKKSVCLSLLKNCLRNGIVTKKEVKEILK